MDEGPAGSMRGEMSWGDGKGHGGRESELRPHSHLLSEEEGRCRVWDGEGQVLGGKRKRQCSVELASWCLCVSRTEKADLLPVKPFDFQSLIGKLNLFPGLQMLGLPHHSREKPSGVRGRVDKGRGSGAERE